MTVAEIAPTTGTAGSGIARSGHRASASSAMLPERPLARRIESAWERLLRARPAPRAIDAAHHEVDLALIGRLGYYVDAHAGGRPIVLVHGLHAWASAFDVAPLFDVLRGERTVYAPDLPGFGTSERGPSTYRPVLYAKALKRFLIDVVSPREEAVDLVAIGLASEIVARLALEAPELVRTVTLIAPTGLERAPAAVSGARASLRERLLGMPLWAAPLFRAMTARPIVRHLARARFSGRVPREYVDHAARTARAPGAHRAPWAILAGALATRDAASALYERLQVPTLVIHDACAGTDPERACELARRNPAVRTLRIEGTRGMPHFERRDEVLFGIRELDEETRRAEEAQARA